MADNLGDIQIWCKKLMQDNVALEKQALLTTSQWIWKYERVSILNIKYLQMGSRTRCIGVALLGFPGPESLIADTRNSSSVPSIRLTTEKLVSLTGKALTFTQSLPFSFFSMRYPETQINYEITTAQWWIYSIVQHDSWYQHNHNKSLSKNWIVFY